MRGSHRLLSMLIDWNDDHFAAMSLACVITVVLVTAHVAFGKRVALEPEDEKPAEPEKRGGTLEPAAQAAE